MRHAEYVDPRPKFQSSKKLDDEKYFSLVLILEFGLGVCQIFGVRHFYAGNRKTGIKLMTTYWFALVANLILVPFAIGLFTLPLTWLIFMVVSIRLAISYAQSATDRFE